MNKGEFSSEEEKRNFQMAMVKIVMNIRETTNDNAYESVIEFIRNI